MAGEVIDIEGGQYYARRINPDKENLGTDLDASVAVAKRSSCILKGAGYTPRHTLLYDDVYEQMAIRAQAAQAFVVARRLDLVQRYIGGLDWNPQIIYREADQEYAAKALIDEIMSKIPDYPEGQEKPVKLFGYHRLDDHPSCEVLDATLYRRKLSDSAVAIVVLNRSYRGQQERVRRLLEIIGEVPEVVNIFFTDKGKVSRVDAWTEGLSKDVADALVQRGIRS